MTGVASRLTLVRRLTLARRRDKARDTLGRRLPEEETLFRRYESPEANRDTGSFGLGIIVLFSAKVITAAARFSAAVRDIPKPRARSIGTVTGPVVTAWGFVLPPQPSPRVHHVRGSPGGEQPVNGCQYTELLLETKKERIPFTKASFSFSFASPSSKSSSASSLSSSHTT